MHNVQHLKHQETQTIYPLTGSSSAVHFSHLFTWIAISRMIFSHFFHSLFPHNSHISQNFIRPSLSTNQEHHARSLTRCCFMTISVRISSRC
ncbi:hypothetical protein Hanom_Chr01g00039341 [Helianthus anomalus]